MNRHERRAAKARASSKDDAFARAICELARMMEQWHAKNPTAELRWHLLPHPPFGLATSDPGARTQLANSPDADRMLLESDAWFARKTGNASTLYMARTALSLVKQLPHIDQLH